MSRTSRTYASYAVRTAATCTAAAMALLVAPSVSLADNGNGPTAQELLDTSKATMRKAKSLHLKLTDESAAAAASQSRPTSQDLALDQDGNCVGSMTLGGGGGSVEMVVRSGQVWIKPDATFWKSQIPGPRGTAVAELFKNRYLHGATSDALLKDMADSCDLRTFQKADADSSVKRPDWKKGADTKVAGTKVTPLTYEKDGRKNTLYLSTDADRHLVELTEKGGGSDLTMTFTDYDKPVPSATPSAAESVDIAQLQGELQKT